jgi:DNA-binding GntR family transcriptional regulator
MRETVINGHEAIVDAIASGDPRVAAARMQAHMRSIWGQIEQTAIKEGDSILGDQSYLPMYDDET